MKKIVALLLALMLLVCGTALADKDRVRFDDSLSFDIVVPEGYSYTSNTFDDVGCLEIVCSKEEGTVYTIYVYPDEEYATLERLNDLPEEELNAFANELCEYWNEPVVEISETGLGSKIVVLNENNCEVDYACVISVFYGYYLSIYIEPVEGAEVTEDDIATAKQFFTDMDFVYTEVTE